MTSETIGLVARLVRRPAANQGSGVRCRSPDRQPQLAQAAIGLGAPTQERGSEKNIQLTGR